MARDDDIREFQTRMLEEQREFMRSALLRMERIGQDQWRELRILDRLNRLDPPGAPA